MNHPFSTAVLLVAAFAAATLSGCTEPKSEPIVATTDLVTVRIPVGAYDNATGGPWYQPDSRNLLSPTTILWVNSDIALHRILGFWEPLQETPPMWVQTAQAAAEGHSHGGGGHTDHGSASTTHQHNATPVFDVTVEAGQTLEMPLPGEGTLLVHCHPHPWMVDTWTVLPANPHPYPVNASAVIRQAQREAETAEGVAQEFDWVLGSPNLLQVSANLSWNDADDDFNGMSQANNPDTLMLEIIAPNGTVVANASLTARVGSFGVSYAVPHPAWPVTVMGGNFAEARQNLTKAWPDFTETAGNWKLRVTVLAAPGPIDGASLPAAVPPADGSQAWVLRTEARNAWGSIGPTQEIPLSATLQ